MTEYITTINGQKLAFTHGQTILEVAEENQIPIPTLCYLKGASPTGRCGICVVEIDGQDEMVSSCSTIAASGMKIKTESKRVIKERKTILAKLLSSGNHNCAIAGSGGEEWSDFQLKVSEADGAGELCPAWGDCRLQELAYQYQVGGAYVLC